MFGKLQAGAAGLALILAAGCETTDYGQREVGARPTDQSSSEASIWYQMDEAEKNLVTSGRVETDPALNAYVRQHACAVTIDYCDDLRIYILKDPSANAAMAPNGMMLVHTGLLLRAEDADQLASILAHEFVHFHENHTMERYATAKNMNRAMIATAGTGLIGLIGILAIADSAASFSQSQETEADLEGFKHLTSAGYNPESAVLMMQHMYREFDASTHDDKQKRANKGVLFASHPDFPQRIAALERKALEFPYQPTSPEAHREIIRPFLETWLDEQIVLRDYGATLHLIDRMSELGSDIGVLSSARGRLLMLRGEEGDKEAATEAFILATQSSDAPASAYRALGDHYRDTGTSEKAITAFELYLEKEPEARDKALIEAWIEDLKEQQ